MGIVCILPIVWLAQHVGMRHKNMKRHTTGYYALREAKRHLWQMLLGGESVRTLGTDDD